MRPLLDKHAAAGNEPVSYDFECRDHICRIRPTARTDWHHLREALHAVSHDEDSRHMLISSIENHFNPYVVYWQITDESVLEFHRELSTRIGAEIAQPCKQQHPERGDIELSLEVWDGKVMPLIIGELARTPMGDCVRTGMSRLVESLQFPTGALPFSSTLRFVAP